MHRLYLGSGVGLPATSTLDMTLNNLMVWLQSVSFRDCEVLFHCHYSQVHSYSVASNRVLSIGKIEQFDFLIVHKHITFVELNYLK